MEERCNLSHLTIQDNQEKKYYVVVNETILCRLAGPCSENIGRVIPGMLVEAIKNEDKDALRVRLHSKTEGELWYKTEWKCHPIDLAPVSQFIWQLLHSIRSLEERVRLVSNKQFCKDVEDIKVNSKVWYSPESSLNPKTYLACVKFVGPVSELGDGYYFGLDILDNPDICKPCPLVKKYFKAQNSNGTFATLSNINTRAIKDLEAIEIFERNFLSNNILSSKTTDNLFITKSKHNTENKRNADSLHNNKYSLLVDTDNNNPAFGLTEPIAFNATSSLKPIKNVSHEQENVFKKLDSNLKSFDPLNSDEEGDEVPKDIQEASNTNDLIGSCVKVLVDNDEHYGIVRWIGTPTGSSSDKIMAAIELDDIHPLGTDGTYQNTRYFQCDPRKAWFTDLKDCHQYDMAASSCYYKPEPQEFETLHSDIISGSVPPISVRGSLEKICGKYHGIQGHHNSCYLDATLFSMFAFTCAFDSLIFRPPDENDCPEYEEVQRVLREEIVNPLRRDLFVEAGHVMKLRTLLEKSSSISGLTSEEKDPEEFLTSLVAQTLNAEPFLKLSSGQDAYHYQLFVEKDDKLTLPTVQQLLEQSFLTSNVRLKEVPSCLILQMPRFGKSYKMYSKIQPTLLLDVTDIIEDSPRQCTVCGKLAKLECKECYGQCGVGLESIAFCKECLDKAHCHERRTNHQPKTLTVPIEYEILKEHCSVPRLYMELLAVVCIETSHYVSFVKCAPGSDAPWCFFDSMADRKGEHDGFNIPEMVPCPDFPYWLSEEGAAHLATVTDDRTLPEHAKRLLCDAYMCMYQSPDVMMYK